MIRLEDELSRFAPIDIKTLEGKLGAIPDEVNTAISMYNKALDDIKNKNDDMAVIALKKAVALYPGFYEAMNLKGLCHLRLEEEEKARLLFAQVMKLDDSSLRAKSYLDQLDGEPLDSSTDKRGNRRPRSRMGKVFLAWLNRGLSPEKAGPWRLKYVLGFLLGALLVGTLWLLVPKDAPLFSFEREQPELLASIAALKKENAALLTQLEDKTRDLESADRIQLQLREEMETYKVWLERIATLREMMDEKLYRDVLVRIEQEYEGLDIPPDLMGDIIVIHEDVKPLALRQIYDAATVLYKSNARPQERDVYQQAMTEFDLAISILDQMEEKPDYAGDLYYTGAKAYWLAGLPSQEEANILSMQTFEKVIELEPGTTRARNATAWIAEVEAGRAVKH